jgi:hypothetical protein
MHFTALFTFFNCIHFNRNENFSRVHVIVGLFDIVVPILMKYAKTDFKSQYLYLYPLGGLSKNVSLLPLELQEPFKNMIFQLLLKFQLDDTQVLLCCSDMNYTIAKQESAAEENDSEAEENA